MRKHLRPLLVAAAAVAMVPASAQAAGKTVIAGPPEEPASAPEGGDVNAFYPKKIKVAKGDTVSFEIRGFHDVYFPGRGKRAPGLVSPDSPIAGVDDAAGQPFWFNGQPRLIVTPALMGPAGDAEVDGGRAADGSGLPLDDGPPPPYEVEFTKKGSFSYFCNVHDGMKGKVTVLNKRKRVPSTSRDAAKAKKQFAKDLATLKRNDRFDGPSGANVQVGNDTKRTAFFRFFPGTQTATVGEPVKFNFAGTSGEIHNIAVGPKDYLDAQAEGIFAPDMSTTPPALVLNPIIFYPSDPPNAFPAWSPALHGNGFINTGALDTVGATPQPSQATIAFSQPGTYSYYCLIHYPDMAGTIDVTG